jgi:hypothetical protein
MHSPKIHPVRANPPSGKVVLLLEYADVVVLRHTGKLKIEWECIGLELCSREILHIYKRIERLWRGGDRFVAQGHDVLVREPKGGLGVALVYALAKRWINTSHPTGEGPPRAQWDTLPLCLRAI